MTNSILAFVFGIGFMTIPDFILDLIGFSDEADGPLMGRFFGIVIFGIGILTYNARNKELAEIKQTIVLFLFFVYGVMDIFHFIFADLTNLMLWSVILVHTIFAALYANFYFRRE